MNASAKFFLFISRLAMGWLMFYAGVTKVINPDWTAAGYLSGSKTFTDFYTWLALPADIGWVDFINEWGLTLLGASLILGIGVRFSSVLGAILMMLYYFPVLAFPFIGADSYIVDEHIIYALILILFASVKAGRIGGLEGAFSRVFFSNSRRFYEKYLG